MVHSCILRSNIYAPCRNSPKSITRNTVSSFLPTNRKYSIYKPILCRYCLIWAAHGLCEAKRRYMSKSCRSACGLCEPRYQAASGLACEDTHDFCTTWSNYGMCTLKPVYMKENCAKSCGQYCSVGLLIIISCGDITPKSRVSNSQ